MKFDRQQFLDDVRRLAEMEVRWLHQGCDPAVGVDCIGAFRWAVNQQGFELPEGLLDEWVYSRPPNGRRFLRILREWLIELQPSELSPSDLIVYYMRRNPQHMAVQMEDGMIGEAFESGVTSKFLIRRPPPDYRIAACFRIPDEF